MPIKANLQLNYVQNYFFLQIFLEKRKKEERHHLCHVFTNYIIRHVNRIFCAKSSIIPHTNELGRTGTRFF